MGHERLSEQPHGTQSSPVWASSLGEVRPRLPARFEGSNTPDYILSVESQEDDASDVSVARPGKTRAALSLSQNAIAESVHNELTPQPPLLSDAMPRRAGSPSPASRAVQPQAAQASDSPPMSDPPRAMPPITSPFSQESPPAQASLPSARAIPGAVQPMIPMPEISSHEGRSHEVQTHGVHPRRIPAAVIKTPDSPETLVTHEQPVTQQRAAPNVISPRIISSAEPVSALPAIAPDRSSTQETVVRVSIGRIEVRVNSPSRTTQPRIPKPAPLRPAVSLSDYLKRRDGGKS